MNPQRRHRLAYPPSEELCSEQEVPFFKLNINSSKKQQKTTQRSAGTEPNWGTIFPFTPPLADHVTRRDPHYSGWAEETIEARCFRSHFAHKRANYLGLCALGKTRPLSAEVNAHFMDSGVLRARQCRGYGDDKTAMRLRGGQVRSARWMSRSPVLCCVPLRPSLELHFVQNVATARYLCSGV